MKLKHAILAVLLFSILGLCFYLNWYDKTTLSDCSAETRAFLADVYHTRKKGYTFVYRYVIDNKVYENREWVMDKEILDAYAVGDSLSIEYGCDDHQVSKIKSLQ